MLADSRPRGAVARAYGVYLEREESSRRALFVIDERRLVRWSQTYPNLYNSGIDGILHALEATKASADEVLRQRRTRQAEHDTE